MRNWHPFSRRTLVRLKDTLLYLTYEELTHYPDWFLKFHYRTSLQGKLYLTYEELTRYLLQTQNLKFLQVLVVPYLWGIDTDRSETKATVLTSAFKLYLTYEELTPFFFWLYIIICKVMLYLTYEELTLSEVGFDNDFFIRIIIVVPYLWGIDT